MPPDDKYWFPAKRFGWGWGLPCRWQGWFVLAIFFVLLLVRPLILPTGQALYTVAYIALISVALVGVCWLKGEPPRARWGGEN